MNNQLQSKSDKLYQRASNLFASKKEFMNWLDVLCKNTPVSINEIDIDLFKFEISGNYVDVYYRDKRIDYWNF